MRRRNSPTVQVLPLVILEPGAGERQETLTLENREQENFQGRLNVKAITRKGSSTS